jgi:hypothetical protein
MYAWVTPVAVSYVSSEYASEHGGIATPGDPRIAIAIVSALVITARTTVREPEAPADA